MVTLPLESTLFSPNSALLTVICFVFVGAGDDMTFSTKTEVALIGSEHIIPDISQEEASTAVAAQILISIFLSDFWYLFK
jgi:hypothetical protein